ncbi:LysM peptidoglycan-binding domain-containing protein [Peribacillus cavernae]|uniref:LysM peptidoglycan-binding domain-containing protein n=1 Tax=Peribacillus cavernae TaxID=1674310 RepID=A0A3S0TYY9_9BACI|nr:LysM peptidoglycan-binding domain-containing protein [Peribacillus cavernae]MDQ0219378.1 hypothetical protein [Peribacillus cavernae]RUQ27746.1 LysM peptidoglycan-binding domain-containing protein [Peribacillus cavernae]
MPPGIEKITAAMVVEAPGYFELEGFIKAVEELPRITKVESLVFTGNQEIKQVEDQSDKLRYNMTVSTYYYPGLEKLKKQLPKYDVPEPGNKVNPFYQSELSIPAKPSRGQEPGNDNRDARDTGENSRIVEINQRKYRVYSYKVKPGDTLFKIAVAFYNSRKGEALIKSWNKMTSLQAGTTIEIPVPVDGKI